MVILHPKMASVQGFFYFSHLLCSITLELESCAFYNRIEGAFIESKDGILVYSSLSPLFRLSLLGCFFLVVMKCNSMNILPKIVLSLILSHHRDFPSTFRGLHGNITYNLTVTISRPWHLSKSFVTELMFVSRMNLNDAQLWVRDPRFFEAEVWVFKTS